MSGYSLDTTWLGIGMALAMVAVLVWVWSRSREYELDLPDGQVIYSDSGVWYRQREALYASSLRLAGRPDFLVEQDDGVIVPVELKSSKAPTKPHEGHILQLAAYCLLVSEVYDIRPTHGIIQYKDKAFAIDYDEALEDDLLDLLDEMRDEMFNTNLRRDHELRGRCARCSFKQVCTDSLV